MDSIYKKLFNNTLIYVDYFNKYQPALLTMLNVTESSIKTDAILFLCASQNPIDFVNQFSLKQFNDWEGLRIDKYCQNKLKSMLANIQFKYVATSNGGCDCTHRGPVIYCSSSGAYCIPCVNNLAIIGDQFINLEGKQQFKTVFHTIYTFNQNDVLVDDVNHIIGSLYLQLSFF